MNVALYEGRRGKWAFTEYTRTLVDRRTDWLSIGANRLAWNSKNLTCRIDETTAPLGAPIRGTVHLFPETSTAVAYALDGSGQHWWQPLVPRARIIVDMEKPQLRWSGTGYLDCNEGAAPLDEAMRSWTWLRSHSSGGTTVIYDVRPRTGPQQIHALKIGNSGEIRHFIPPPPVSLPTTGWRIQRETPSDPDFTPRVVATLEDTPFYARSVLDTTIAGERQTAFHESLSLDRFRSPWVRSLLPFRMRRSRR